MTVTSFERRPFRLVAIFAAVICLGLTVTNLGKVQLYLRLSQWRNRWQHTEYYSQSEGGDKLGDVQNQACSLPQLKPGDENLRHLDWTSAAKTTPPKCYKSPVLFTIDLDSRLIRKNEKHPLSKLATECYFKKVERDYERPEFQYLNISTLHKITGKIVKLPKNIQTVFVWCVESSRNVTIYEDYLSAVQPKENKLQAQLKQRVTPNNKDLWSVLMIAQDTVSHMSFQRYQPHVHDFLLKEMDAIEFHGFNSLGSHTYKSLFPLFTGLPLPLYERRCIHRSFHNESCPYIWKEFAARGYRTGFSEDSIHEMGAFNYRSFKGLTKPTFDYDFRELTHLLETQELKGHESHFESHFCHGSRMRVETVFDHALKMARTFAGKPYWFLAWTQSLTHISNPLAQYAEEPLLSTLKHLHANQLLYKTIFVLFSDHGRAWGNFRRSSRQGFLEERLAMLYVVLPKAFRQRYPLASRNMQGNVNRLTTAYDLRATMEHLLQPETLEDAAIEFRSQDSRSLEGNKSVSLFLPISPQRTCDTIPFQDNHCICLDRIVLSTAEESVKATAAAALTEINARLSNYTQCHQLHLANITQAFKVKSKKVSYEVESRRFHSRNSSASRLWEEFEIEIETEPGNGAFFCSVSASYENAKHKAVNRISIVRVNQYGQAGDCVPNLELRPLCFCRR